MTRKHACCVFILGNQALNDEKRKLILYAMRIAAVDVELISFTFSVGIADGSKSDLTRETKQIPKNACFKKKKE